MNSVSTHTSQIENESILNNSKRGLYNTSRVLIDNRTQAITQRKVLEDNRPETKSSIVSNGAIVTNNEDNQSPIKNSRETTSKEGTFADLHEPPVALPRTKEQQKIDLIKVNKLLSTIAKKVKTTKEIATYFPVLKERYQLTDIGFEKSGSKGYRIHININPSFYFTAFDGNIMDSNMHQVENDPKYTETNLTLPSGQSDNVGTSMIDHLLTSRHPKGSSPTSSAEKNLFEGLPTKGKVPKGVRNGNNIYIKGHLLNDNLGGPGEAKNLYPITGQANADHERNIEADAKHLVNVEGYHVYYDVRVVPKAKNLISPGLSSVDADFVCHLSPLTLDSSGTTKKHLYKRVTIHSTYGGKTNSELDAHSDLSQRDAHSKDASFDPTKVEWAPSRDSKVQINFTPLAKSELEEFSDEDDFLREVQGISGIGPERARLAWSIFNNGRNSSLTGRPKQDETLAIKAINDYYKYQVDHATAYQAASAGGAPPVAGSAQGLIDGHNAYHTDRINAYHAARAGGALPVAGSTQGLIDGHNAYHADRVNAYQIARTGVPAPVAGSALGLIDGHNAYHADHATAYQAARAGEAPPVAGSAQGLIDGHNKYIYDTHYANGYQVARNGQHFLSEASQGQLDGYNAYHAQVATAQATITAAQPANVGTGDALMPPAS